MSGRSHANTSRGLRHIKKYLGEDAERLARSNRAADVVPVLQKRQRTATTAAEEGPLSAEVLAHVRASCPNAAKKLSTRQTRLVESLADVRALRRLKTDLTHESSISIKRVHLESIEAMSDAIAIASIQRQWSAAAGSHEVAHAHAVEGASLCVLVDDHDAAVAMQADLAARYPCATVALLDADATTSSTDEEAMTALRFPTFPLGDAPTRRGGQSPRRRSPSPTRGGAGSEPRSPPSPTCPESESVASCAIVLITPAAFVAVDRRSAIWKFFGAFVVILSRHNSALLQLPMSDAHHDVLSMPQLSAHRWSCLGHVAVAAVLSTTSATLTAPRLDWLTTHRPTTNNNNTSSSSAHNTSLSPTKDASISPNKAPVALAAAPLAASRREVRIHYAALDGMPRFLLLFSLIKGLVPGRGLVVHVATKAMAAYLYEALYALDAEVPSFVRLLTDYDGASSLSVVQSPEGRAQLIHVFAEVVSAGRQTTSTPPPVGAHTSAVLISCYGIVPPAGDVFVCYDIIPDVPNFGLFVADSLTPGAVEQPSPAANNNNNNNDTTTTTGQRETKAHKRTRCHSPIPLIGQDGESPRGSQQHTDPRSPSTPNNTDQHSFSSSGTLHNYSFIILLLRTNEMSGALRHLRAAGKRLHITYTPLEARQMPSVARFRLVADKMQSLHQKMFSIQNLAYSAYKDTMTAYATVGPRDVYDERNVSLEKVAEEFGFTEVPLLDLRLRDTPFRPKEDYFKAAQKKAVEERRRYRSFADQHIIGEAPEPHEVDEEPQE